MLIICINITKDIFIPLIVDLSVSHLFAVPVWSGVTVGGVRLMDLASNIGSNEDPENWKEIHEEVINR